MAWDAGLLTDLSMDVHHRDHDKQNNDLTNLEVMEKSDHHRQHIAEAGFVTNQYGVWPVRATGP